MHVIVGKWHNVLAYDSLVNVSKRPFHRPVARLDIEGGRDIFQAGLDMFVTLSKRFSKNF